jgi:hypothetical protein
MNGVLDVLLLTIDFLIKRLQERGPHVLAHERRLCTLSPGGQICIALFLLVWRIMTIDGRFFACGHLLFFFLLFYNTPIY